MCVLNACCYFVIGIIGLIAQLSMILLGFIRYDECVMEPWIPKFLIVAGGIGVVTIILTMFSYCYVYDGGFRLLGYLLALLTLVTIVWNVAGSYWVFSNWTYWDKVRSTKKGCMTDLYFTAIAYLVLFWLTCPCQTYDGLNASKHQRANIN